MIRRFLQKLLTKPIIRLTNKYGSRPDRDRIFKALSEVHQSIAAEPGKKGPVISFGPADKFIIFSDQHKGTRNYADDFASAEKNYLAALAWYNTAAFTCINLGDSEELWENGIAGIKKYNTATFESERLFLERNAFIKVFGNHDLYWDNDPLAAFNLESIYKQKVKVYEGVLLQTTLNDKTLDIFLTHGHQGDLQSDGNWFSKWFVSNIWAPFQSFLRINPNTPAYDTELKSIHNQLMYEWSIRQENLILITGHTHQPVFKSLTYIERLYLQLEQASAAREEKAISALRKELKIRMDKGEVAPVFKAYRPNYFNSGCCCFNDGDITGLEIDEGCIRLIKWEYDAMGKPGRIILEETRLSELIMQIS